MRKIREVLNAAIDILFGYDFFISYAHGDGKEYPRSLANRLEADRYKAFLDERVYVAGDDLRNSTRRRVRMSRVLIVVLGPSALESFWVAREVEECLAAKRRLVVIDLDRVFENAPTDNQLKRLLLHNIYVRDTSTNGRSSPSEPVVAALKQSFQSTRQEILRLRAAVSALVIVASIGSLALYQYHRSQQNLRLAQKTESIRNAGRSIAATEDGNTDSGLALALCALPQARTTGSAQPDSSEAEHALLLATTATTGEILSDQASRLVKEYRNRIESQALAPLIIRVETDISSAYFSPDGRYLLTISPRQVAIWNSKTGDQVGLLPSSTEQHLPVEDALFSPDGTRLLALHHGRGVLWDMNERKIVAIVPGSSVSETPKSDFSLDNQFGVTTSSSGIAWIWNAKTGKELWVIDAHKKAVNQNRGVLSLFSAAFSADSKSLITSWNGDQTTRVWSTLAHQQIDIQRETTIRRVLTRNGRKFIPAFPRRPDINVATGDGRWTVIGTFPNQDDGPPAVFSDNRQYIARIQGEQVIVSDSNSGKKRLRLRSPKGPFASLAFNSDGAFLVTVATAETRNVKVQEWDDGVMRYVNGQVVDETHVIIWPMSFPASLTEGLRLAESRLDNASLFDKCK